MKDYNKNKFEMKNIQDLEKNKVKTKESNLYFIFTIDKNNFDIKQITFEILSKTKQKSYNTNLIRYDEFRNKDLKNKILMINQLYCISFNQPNDDSKEVCINLHLKLKNNLNWIKSLEINVPKRKYIFLYEHSFEDLNKNHRRQTKNIKIIQTQLDFQQKYTYFLKKLNIEECENKELTISFVKDSMNQIKKGTMPYHLIFNLLQISYKKTNDFYYILSDFYKNQNNIYFPKSINVKKFKPFVELITNEKNDLIDFYTNEKIKDNNKKNISLYLKIFKETFYRKYDSEDYIKLSQDKDFLQLIKKQILSNNITNEDNINPKIINSILNIIYNVEEINFLFKLYSNLSEILKLIIENYEQINNIYIQTNENIELKEITQKIEENNLEEIKKLHKIILELEKEHNFPFINFNDIIKQYISHFSLSNLDNLIILREMIVNQRKYGQPLKELEKEINNTIHKTGISIAPNLKSNEIINFINKIDIINYNRKELKIINSININDLNEEDIKNFNEIWNKVNKEDNENMISLIFDKIVSMKDIGLVLRLIPNVKFNSKMASYLDKLFQNFFSSYNEEVCPNIINDISNILLIFSLTNYNSDDFFNFIENKLSQKTLNSLYIDIIKNQKLSENDFIKIRIIHFFTQNNTIYDIDSIFYILGNIIENKNNELLEDFANSINKFIIVKEDFFNKKCDNKFKLYQYIQSIFSQNKINMENYEYFKKSKEILNILEIKINTFNFTYKEVISLKEQINDNYFKEKLKIINNYENIEIIYDNLKDNINKIDYYYNELLMLQHFYILFFSNSEKDYITDINNKINLLNVNFDINNLYNLEDFFNSDIKYKNTAKKYNKLRFSKFFIGLFNNYKQNSKETEIQKFKNSVQLFCELEILNHWDDNYTVNEIPYLEIISKEIEKIIKESNNNKKKCISLIHRELKIIKYIYQNEENKPIFNKDKFINNNIAEINNNIIDQKINEDEEELELDDEDEYEYEEEENQCCNEDSKKDNPQNIKRQSQNVKPIHKKYYLEQNLIYLPFIDTLKKVFNSILILIELFGVQKTAFYDDIREHFQKFKKINKGITLREIKQKSMILLKFKKININIVSFNKNDNTSILIEFLTMVGNNVEGIKFAFGKTNEEIRALSEFVGESENSKIQIRDIQDFMNVCNFFQSIRVLNIKHDVNLIEEFKVAFATMPSFGNSFNNYLTNFKEIKNIYQEYLDKPEVSRKKIEQILKLSNINIYFDNTIRSIQIKGTYTDISNNDKTFNSNDLQELHDRALLFSNKTFDNISNNVIDKAEQKQHNSLIFVDIVEDINILVSYLTSLYIKGYPNSIKIEIKIEKSIAMDIGRNNIKDLIKNYKSLTTYLEDAQTKAYKEKPLISLIYGQQFYDIYNYLTNKNINIDIVPLLKKISDNKIRIIPNIFKNNYYFEDKYNFTPMIDAINNFLNECLLINKIQLKDFYENNIIKNDKAKIKPGFYTWTVDEMDFEIHIISLYKKLTGNLPLPITLLLCTKETNEEEITSFIYRAILCPYPVLFIIVNSENLELSNAQYFLWILESLYEKNKRNIKSSLLVFFNDTNSNLRIQLTLLNGHSYFTIDNLGVNNNNEIKNDYQSNPIKVWTSDIAGIGKSEKIKYEAEQLKLNYIYFPIGGSFNRKELINRIIKLNINKNNYKDNYFHIDIYDSDKESSIIIREFLFSLLIIRNYSYDEKIFYLGYGAKISIEIPTGFYNMEDKFKLLNYFTTEKLTLESLPELREIEVGDIDENNNKQNNNITDIQLVTNILKMLENDSIINKSFDLEIKHEKIAMKDCQNTINKYFTLEKGNYYQKMAFIHILADQFKKFCYNFYLNPEELAKSELSKRDRINYPFNTKIEKFDDIMKILQKNDENYIKSIEIKKIRKIMIENLVKLTLYFVKGPYNKIALNQKKTNSQLFCEFDEKKINEIANEYLSNKDEIISFEKINPSLVFFNEDVQTFSIITTAKKGEDEYNKLLRIYNSQSDLEHEKDSLVNYRELTHEEFLPEVKNILNLNILSTEKIKSIIGSYCFTSDNFIKMILILLRTRAGIPVILMGETGCGKTSLIKMLSSLLNKGKMNLKIMNIHAGIKDQDIIDFIEKVNEEVNNINNNNPNEKIWVFFDEINTCNSMGLLSEIFYKHSYFGKKLNKKLTFIAACNPYRLKLIKKEEKDKEDDFCLNVIDNNYNYTKQKLVYLVNPLPHSLLTSIFDFGKLSSQDEKKYIQSIVKETVKKYNIDNIVENLIVNEIVVCQNYIRDNNDISSVSLRELRRFNILFEFFVKYLENKNKNENKINNNDIYISTLCLCLYFCYYIRLSNNKSRYELRQKIEEIMKGKKYSDIIQEEKKYIVSQVKIPPGIARNTTLLENIFSLFVCIVNKIPLIICGKPGTSKSLSFQILYDSMKGNRSDNDFFKQYPELLVFSYQGSKTSTSEGVVNVFNKARSCLKKNKEKYGERTKNFDIINNNNIIFNGLNSFNGSNRINIPKEDNNIKDEIIAVVYFDEMGLAEESPNNPLKVIHSELEYDDNELKVAFVGISNWKLDSSKMNRTIFLGVPPLEEKDLQDTALEISSNLDQRISIEYSNLFSNLVKTYYKYKDDIKSSNQNEFHGLRDFYHLIKNAMHYLLNEKNNKQK